MHFRPADLIAPVYEWNPRIATVTDPNWWHRHLPDWTFLGPSVHAFTDPIPSAVTQFPGLYIPQCPGPAARPRSAVDSAEWDEGGFAGDGIELAWRASDDTGQTIAAANLTASGEVPTDVGVPTNPIARGHGAGTSIASVAASYDVQEFGIARWRALTTNSPSLRIAERLGFEPDCLQIALRPPAV